MAARSAKRPDIKAIVLDPSDGGDLLGFAYRRALETATRSALPLSKEERKRAVLRLKAECPDLSHRAIAKLVGVSHDTVDRWTRTEDESEEQSRPSTAFETPAQAARRFANDLGRLYESRGILDMLIPKRMGQALAIALADQLGSGARARAETFAQWTAIAVQVLAAEDR